MLEELKRNLDYWRKDVIRSGDLGLSLAEEAGMVED